MVAKDNTTSLARLAADGVAVMTEHTVNSDSSSATFTTVGIENSATVQEERVTDQFIKTASLVNC